MKKFTLLSLFLLSALGFVNAQTYTWSIPEGGEVEEFSEVTLTVSEITGSIDGQYGNTGECGLYRKSDNKLIYSFGAWWCPYYIDIVDGTSVFTLEVSSDAVWPDYPMKTPGEYYIKINAGFFRFDWDWSANTGGESPELLLNFTIKPEPTFLAQSDVTISPEPSKLKECPEAWVLTINNPEVTSVAISDNATFGFYQNSYTQWPLTATVGEDGKTITLTPGDDLKNQFMELYQGTYRLIVFEGSLYCNGDEANINALMQFEYEIPEYAEFADWATFPAGPEERWDDAVGGYVEVPSILSKLEFCEIYYSDSNNAQIVIPEAAADKSNIPYVEKYDEATATWVFQSYMTAEFIAPVQNQYGSYSNPGVKLTPEAGTILTPGEYKVAVPQGAYIVNTPELSWRPANSMETKYFEVVYTIKEAPEVSTTPVWSIEEGAVLESFTEVRMTFAGLKNLEIVDEYDSAYNIFLYRVNDDESLTELGKLTVGVNNQDTGWQTIIEIDENGGFVAYMNEDNFKPYYPLDIDGNYRIKLPRGAYKFEGFNDLVNAASELNFSIKTSSLLKTEGAVLDPAPCEIKDFLDKATITFANEEITSLELGLVPTSQDWGYDETGAWVELFEDLPAKAELVQATQYSAWPVGTYNIEFNAENPRQIILTRDTESIPDYMTLQPGSYFFRIPRGGLIANKGTETECTNSVLEFGNWDYIERYNCDIYSPVPGEVESIEIFRFKLKDNYGNDGYWNSLKIGEVTPELYVYDEARADWVLYTEMVAEYSLDGTTGNDTPTVKVPYYPIYEGGKYKLVIPRGTFICEQYGGTYIENEYYEAEYTIVSEEKPYKIEATPAEGLVPFIDDITFKVTDVTGAYIWDEYVEDAAVAINEDGEVIGKGKMSCFYAEDWSINFLIDFEPAILALGPCRVVVAYNVFDTNYDGIGDNLGFELNYNIIGGDATLSVTPAEGSTVKEFNEFTFAWQGALNVEVGIEEEANMIAPKLYDAEGTEAAYLDYTIVDAKTVTLTVAEDAKFANGEYTLKVPAGYFIIDGKACEEMEFNYTLEAVTYGLSIVEAPIAKLMLTANYCDELKVNTDCASEITLCYRGEEDVQVGTYEIGTPVGTSVELTLNATTELLDGDYILTIPAECFWVDNELSKELRYLIQGVVSIDSLEEDANFDVYGINGMIIKRNASKSDIKDLDPGVYVINGNKVLVK